MEKTITVRKIQDNQRSLTMAYALREEVFVLEQKVAWEEEFDEFEEESHHFLATDEEGEAIGVARWRRTNAGIKLERFAVREDVRGKGVGAALVGEVIADIVKLAGPDERMYLHAQLPAVTLYSKFGFRKKGEQFLECDIWHYEMEREVGGNGGS